MASIALGIGALAGGLGGAAISANAAGSAADQQVAEQQKALDFQQQVYGDQQQRIAPFVNAGNLSIAQLMNGLQTGEFGPGSVVPYTAPTLSEMQGTPGYEFTRQQGEKGILEGAAAAGGSITGGTLKALDTFNTGLADSTYNDVFTRSLQTYQQNLATQAQQFQQLLTPAALGENAIASINNTGSGAAINVGNLMSGIGNAQAAGTVGAANAWNGGLQSGIGSLMNLYLLSNFMKSGGFGFGGGGPMMPGGATYNVPQPVPALAYGEGPG